MEELVSVLKRTNALLEALNEKLENSNKPRRQKAYKALPTSSSEVSFFDYDAVNKQQELEDFIDELGLGAEDKKILREKIMLEMENIG